MPDNSQHLDVCVIIPAYNEHKTIGGVIKSVKKQLPGAHIAVMNDGSTDATRDVAQGEGVTVLDLPFNLGIGGAVQTGLKYAWREGYRLVVEIDADGQHDPDFAGRLIGRMDDRSRPVDMLIGSRFISNTSYRSSLMRQFGIHLFSFLIKMVSGQRVYDSTSGYRVYNRKALGFLAEQYPADFPEPESIIMLINNGFNIGEYPVTMKSRQAGVSVVSSDFSLKAGYFVVSNAIAILVGGLKTKKSYVR